MKYNGIIFDCDGVLVDSETISSRILIEMAHSLGIKLNIPESEAVIRFSGVSMQTNLSFLEEMSGYKLPADFEQEFRHRSYNAFRQELKAIEGIYEILDSLPCEYCVASSGPREKIILNLTTTKLIEKFEGRIYSSYDIDSWKPEPDIFLYAADNMGLKSSECAVIEDSISGVIAAVKGGFDVYGYANSFNKHLLEQHGATVFFHMSELLQLLELQ